MAHIDDPRALERLFNEAHAAWLAGDTQDVPIRIVLARDINIPEGYEPLPNRLDQMRPGFQHERRRYETPSAPPIAVVERADGTLWTFENAPILTLFHEMAALARLRVAVIASERPQPKKTATFRHAPRR
jgi:hypothetical protein